MLYCSYCGKSELDSRIINQSDYGLLCMSCAGKVYRGATLNNPIPAYGEVEYDRKGNPICHLCGEGHRKLMTHVGNSHRMKAYDYKKQFGLETTKSLMHADARELARKRNQEHYDKVVKENLLKKGQQTRYETGYVGRGKEQVSEQTRRKLSHNFKQRHAEKKEISENQHQEGEMR